MLPNSFAALILLATVLLASLNAGANQPATRYLPNQYLLYQNVAAALQTGNAVIYTVPVASTANPSAQTGWNKDCGTTPAVSKEGLRQARAIAEAIRRLAAPLGAVSSSEDCAAMTTATYIKSNPTLYVRVTPDLNPAYIQRIDSVIDEVIRERLSVHFNIRWQQHTTLLVASQQPSPITIHPVLTDLQPGEAAIFIVPEIYQFDFVAKLNTRQWEEMTRYFAPPRQKKSASSKKSK